MVMAMEMATTAIKSVQNVQAKELVQNAMAQVSKMVFGGQKIAKDAMAQESAKLVGGWVIFEKLH